MDTRFFLTLKAGPTDQFHLVGSIVCPSLLRSSEETLLNLQMTPLTRRLKILLSYSIYSQCKWHLGQ